MTRVTRERCGCPVASCWVMRASSTSCWTNEWSLVIWVNVAVAQQVGPGVADVSHGQLAAALQHGDRRAAHAREVLVLPDRPAQAGVGVRAAPPRGRAAPARRTAPRRRGGPGRPRSWSWPHRLQRDHPSRRRARAGAGRHTRSPRCGTWVRARDGSAPRSAGPGSWVSLAVPGRSGRCAACCRRTTGWGGPVSRVPPRKVPLVEPRSSTNHPSALGKSRACRPEAKSSSRTRAHSGLRPMRMPDGRSGMMVPARRPSVTARVFGVGAGRAAPGWRWGVRCAALRAAARWAARRLRLETRVPYRSLRSTPTMLKTNSQSRASNPSRKTVRVSSPTLTSSRRGR